MTGHAVTGHDVQGQLCALATQLRRRYFGAWAFEGLVAGASAAVWLAPQPGNAFVLLWAGSAALWWALRFSTAPRVRALDAAAVVRWLDRAFPELEDSGELLMADPASLQGLSAFQRRRVLRVFETRIARAGTPRPAALEALPSPRPLALGVLAALLAVGFPLSTGLEGGPLARLAAAMTARADGSLPPAAGVTADVAAVEIRVVPPAYQDTAPYRVSSPALTVPEGATLEWHVRVTGTVADPYLDFHDGRQVALVHEGGAWRSPPVPARATVYRIAAASPWAGGERFHVVRVVPDRPPVFDVSSPGAGVTQIAPAPGGTDPPVLVLDATVEDDFGLAGAVARLTLASGSGENVRFREQAHELETAAPAGTRKQRYRRTFDLGALGMQAGDELYLFLEARDNRYPEANVARSRTYVVRWLGEEAAALADVDAMAVRVMPEYFRSQRQIIIDTEALLAEAGALSAQAFRQRSQAIAFDQKALRLRYGTFLGEEAVSGIGPDGEGGGVPAGGDSGHDDFEDHEDHEEGHDHDHDHADAGAGGAFGERAPVFGRTDGGMAAYAHVHDVAEQATLFDPETRELLRAALAQMWEAELQLRLAAPRAALPFEYEALELIKRVQQRSRIYLSRVGFRTTPPDEARRLSGELDGVSSYEVASGAREDAAERILRDALATLTAPRSGSALDAPAGGEVLPEAVRALLLERSDGDPEVLATLGALDALRRDPACGSCREQVASGLWAMLPPPLAPASARRLPASVIAERYRELSERLPPR